MTRHPRRTVAQRVSLLLLGLMIVRPAFALSPSFESFEPAPEADLVRMVAAQIDGDRVTLDIRIGGPTTSRAYHTFVLEVLIDDPTVIEFVEGSGLEGTFLAPPVSLLASPLEDRVVIGISTLGMEGRGTDQVEETVLSLQFRALIDGQTRLSFGGRYGLIEGPVALDVNGMPIPSARFGTGGLLTVTPERPVPVSGAAPPR